MEQPARDRSPRGRSQTRRGVSLPATTGYAPGSANASVPFVFEEQLNRVRMSMDTLQAEVGKAVRELAGHQKTLVDTLERQQHELNDIRAQRVPIPPSASQSVAAANEDRFGAMGRSQSFYFWTRPAHPIASECSARCRWTCIGDAKYCSECELKPLDMG